MTSGCGYCDCGGVSVGDEVLLVYERVFGIFILKNRVKSGRRSQSTKQSRPLNNSSSNFLNGESLNLRCLAASCYTVTQEREGDWLSMSHTTAD